MPRSHALRLALILLGVAAPCTSPAIARAESSEWNLHIDLGPSLVLAGAFRPDQGGSGDFVGGGIGMVSVDWQVFQPLALELIVGGGVLGSTYPVPGPPWGYFAAGAGVRYRLIDNMEGYLDESGGDYLGNAWIAAHIGYHFFGPGDAIIGSSGSRFGIDAALGYEFSVLHPMQLGAFVRATLMLPGPPAEIVDFMLTAGLEASFELAGEVAALDSDDDGLADERETREHRTDPRDPDTDDDGIRDGDEVELGFDALDADMDDDGLPDGREERNANGMRDAGETDPRNRDSDGGGVADGWEVNNSHDGLNPADDDSDRDGVLEDVDACPNTPEGSEIDARGCILIREQIVLDGIEFETGSAAILASSESRLMRALQILLDNPDVRVEIGGHTDDVGGTVANRTLSSARAESVRDWLVSHGIQTGRMTTRGYGESRPRAANDTEENRALNRRIEFRVLH